MPNTEIVRTISASALETRGDPAIGKDFVAQWPDWSNGTISDHGARFISGLAHFANVRNAVEIGVASGWSSAVLLKALGTLDGGSKVTGIDLSPHYYLDKAIPTGRAVDELGLNVCRITGS